MHCREEKQLLGGSRRWRQRFPEFSLCISRCIPKFRISCVKRVPRVARHDLVVPRFPTAIQMLFKLLRNNFGHWRCLWLWLAWSGWRLWIFWIFWSVDAGRKVIETAQFWLAHGCAPPVALVPDWAMIWDKSEEIWNLPKSWSAYSVLQLSKSNTNFFNPFVHHSFCSSINNRQCKWPVQRSLCWLPGSPSIGGPVCRTGPQCDSACSDWKVHWKVLWMMWMSCAGSGTCNALKLPTLNLAFHSSGVARASKSRGEVMEAIRLSEGKAERVLRSSAKIILNTDNINMFKILKCDNTDHMF